MRQLRWMAWLQMGLMIFVLSGCKRRSDDVWDDTKSCSRHIGRGFRSLAGKHGDSRVVRCRDEFMCASGGFEDYGDLDFEPLPDQPLSPEAYNYRVEPGQNGSVPGIEAFQDPSYDPQLRGIFRRVQFPYNSSLVKGGENMEIVRSVAGYMKQHPNSYIFIEGHCDERGAEAFNLALGARRSNAVREVLMKEGVSPDHVFTVSYGRERPLDLGHTEESWSINRRAEFKIYNGRG